MMSQTTAKLNPPHDKSRGLAIDARFGNPEFAKLIVLHAHERDRSADVIVRVFEENAALELLDVD